jgi:hypothetical protein
VRYSSQDFSRLFRLSLQLGGTSSDMGVKNKWEVDLAIKVEKTFLWEEDFLTRLLTSIESVLISIEESSWVFLFCVFHI